MTASALLFSAGLILARAGQEEKKKERRVFEGARLITGEDQRRKRRGKGEEKGV